MNRIRLICLLIFTLFTQILASNNFNKFIEDRNNIREIIKKKQLEEIEKQKLELETKQSLIMAEKTEFEDYVERIKYCYKILSKNVKELGEQKYIIEGYDPKGNLIKGESDNLIKDDFDVSNSIFIFYNTLIYFNILSGT